MQNEKAVLNQVIAQGKHPGIVHLEQTFLNAATLCLAYEFVEGGELANLLQDWHAGGKKPSSDEVARLMLELCEIVGYAHRLNPPIVHRDLKPQNVLLVPKREGGFGLKIADFGIGGVSSSKLNDRVTRSTGYFMTTAVKDAYTPNYASQQQMNGEAPDTRDDVYALGVIWYQLLVGDLSTRVQISGKVRQRLKEEYGLREEHLLLLESCVELEEADRPQDAGVIAETLAATLGRTARLRLEDFVSRAASVVSSSTVPSVSVGSVDESSLPEHERVRLAHERLQREKALEVVMWETIDKSLPAKKGFFGKLFGGSKSGPEEAREQAEKARGSSDVGEALLCWLEVYKHFPDASVQWFLAKSYEANGRYSEYESSLRGLLQATGSVLPEPLQRHLREKLAGLGDRARLDAEQRRIALEESVRIASEEARRRNPNQAAEQSAIATAKREGKRFAVVGNGTVIDTTTGLMWACEDSYKENKSGSKDGENWGEAKAYCESYRGGNYSDWRMPTLAELKELYAAFVGRSSQELEREFWSKGNFPFIVANYPHIVANKARNASIWIYHWIWSSDQRSSEAAFLDFGSGGVVWDAQSGRYYGSRALPVRSGK